MSTLKSRIKRAKKGHREPLLYNIVQQHRLKYPNHAFSEEAVELAKDILRRNDNTDRIGRNSPSSGGACKRAAVFSFFGYPSKKDLTFPMLNRFKDGDYGHLMWQLYFFDIGLLEKAEFQVQNPKWGVKGTCDGLLAVPNWKDAGVEYDPRMSRQDFRDIVESGCRIHRLIAEIKRMNEFRFSICSARQEPEPGITWQGNQYYFSAKTDPEIDSLHGICYWLENKNTNEILEFDLRPTKDVVKVYDAFYGDDGGVLEYARARILPEQPFDPEIKDRNSPCSNCWHKERCIQWDEKGKYKIGPYKDKPMGNFATVLGV